jgi:hypothetical protein
MTTMVLSAANSWRRFSAKESSKASAGKELGSLVVYCGYSRAVNLMNVIVGDIYPPQCALTGPKF